VEYMQRVEKLAAHLLTSPPVATMSRPPITSHVLDTGTGSRAHPLYCLLPLALRAQLSHCAFVSRLTAIMDMGVGVWMACGWRFDQECVGLVLSSKPAQGVSVVLDVQTSSG